MSCLYFDYFIFMFGGIEQRWHIKRLGCRYCGWLKFRGVPVFIRPSSDGTYYGIVMSVRPSVRVSVRPSVRPSVRHSFPHFSPTCFEILSWNFVYHFILMHVRASSNAMNFCQCLLELCPFLTSNMQFSALFSYMLWDIELKFCIWLCFTVLQIKFECRQFASIFVELCPFWNLNYWKYTVFRTFLLHALTYWAEILHMTLFYCTTDQVRVSSICVNFCGSYAPFGT